MEQKSFSQALPSWLGSGEKGVAAVLSGSLRCWRASPLLVSG